MIAWAEFLCGPVEPYHVGLAERIVSRHFSFEEGDAMLTAQLFNQSGRRRGSLADCMIAGTAVRHKASLATENPSDFRRFETMSVKRGRIYFSTSNPDPVPEMKSENKVTPKA